MDSTLLIALRLGKEGYGSPDTILNMATDLVLAMLEYTTFLADYEEAAVELSQKKT